MIPHDRVGFHVKPQMFLFIVSGESHTIRIFFLAVTNSIHSLIQIECVRFLHSYMDIHICIERYLTKLCTPPYICNMGWISHDIWEHAIFDAFMWSCWMRGLWIFFDRNSYKVPIVGAGKRQWLYRWKVFQKVYPTSFLRMMYWASYIACN